MNYWLIKSEPDKYPFEQLLKDKSTSWDGIRNYAARNNLRDMKKGDLLLFYHSNIGKEIVGLAKVLKEFYQDPTSEDPNWVAVEIGPYKKLKSPVSLHQIKTDKRLKDMLLIKLSRLSVVPVKKEEFDLIIALGDS